MAEKVLYHAQNRTKEGALVIPMDDPRTYDYANVTIAKSDASSGLIYTKCSGKDIYIKHMLVSEYSGALRGLKVVDSSGDITPYIPIEANACVSWDPRPAACGPTHGTYLFYNTPGAFYGQLTLVVQVDPQIIE